MRKMIASAAIVTAVVLGGTGVASAGNGFGNQCPKATKSVHGQCVKAKAKGHGKAKAKKAPIVVPDRSPTLSSVTPSSPTRSPTRFPPRSPGVTRSWIRRCVWAAPGATPVREPRSHGRRWMTTFWPP